MGLFDFWRNSDTEETPVQTVSRRIIKTTPAKLAEPTNKVRGFSAANVDNVSADWFAPTTSINQLLASKLPLMRARVRDRMRNDDYAVGYKKLCIQNVIGPTGFKLQAMAKNQSGERDELAVEAIEKAWKRWGKYSDYVDVSGRSNWKDILVQLYKNYLTDGECILRHIEGSEGGEYGYSIQVVESDLLDINLNLPVVENGNRIIMGVELNRWNKPIAYHFLTQRDETDVQNAQGKKHIRVEAKDIIHWFDVEFTNQVRGIPPLSVGLNRLKQLSGFEMAALINSRASASKMGFYYKDNVTEQTPGFEENEDGELLDEITPASMTVLPDGYRFESFDSKFPDNALPDFVKSQLRAISSGLGVDYYALGSDLSAVNLSSARVGILESRESWKGIQTQIIDNIITPVFEKWLFNALMRKKILIGNKPLTVINIEKYKEVKWMGRRWSFPDPTKDSKAAELLLNNRIKAPSSIASDLGIDYEQELELMKRDDDLLEKAGLQRIGVNSLPVGGEVEDQEEVEAVIAEEVVNS